MLSHSVFVYEDGQNRVDDLVCAEVHAGRSVAKENSNSRTRSHPRHQHVARPQRLQLPRKRPAKVQCRRSRTARTGDPQPDGDSYSSCAEFRTDVCLRACMSITCIRTCSATMQERTNARAHTYTHTVTIWVESVAIVSLVGHQQNARPIPRRRRLLRRCHGGRRKPVRNVQAIAEAAEWGSWPPGAWEAIVARGGHEAHLACPGRRRLKSVRRTFRPLGHKLQCTEEGADRPLRAAASDAKRGGAVLRRKGERVRAAAALLDVEGKDDAREHAPPRPSRSAPPRRGGA